MSARSRRVGRPVQAIVLIVAAGLAGLVAAQEGEDAPPAPTRLRERVEVRLVQIDVSVIDPEGSSYRSVTGLQKDDFVVRLDGRDLTEEQRSRLRIDEICDDDAAPLADVAETKSALRQEAPDRPVIAFIDFNYLDAQGRQNVARALEKIADSVDDRRAAFKIYGYTRELRLLTTGFTRSPEELRQVASMVRDTAYRTKPASSVLTNTILSENVSSAIVDPGIAADDLDSFSSSIDDALGAAAGNDPLQRFGQGTADAEEASSRGQAGRSLLAEIAYSNIWGDAFSDYDPSASLAALRTILLAHAHVPWRKALVVFSSEAFRFTNSEKEEWELLQMRELSRKGYTVWTVDVAGISRVATGVSRLLSSLAADSGGDSLRRTGDLARAIDGASEQLACYYLVSLPVSVPEGKGVRHSLTVKLNREGASKERAAQLFRYQVRSPAELFVQDRKSRAVETRLSALLSPDDFREPPVSVTLDFPVRISDKYLSKTRLRVPLSRLSWEPSPDGVGVVAKVLPAAVVQRHTKRGRDQVCSVDAENVGPLELALPREPRPGSRAALAIEFPCVLEKDGMYAARGILTDLTSGKTGAGRSTVIIEREGSESWSVLAPRVEAVSGLDLVWGPGAKRAERDKARFAWRAVGRRGDVLLDEEVALRYILCGPDSAQAGGSLRHFLVRLGSDSSVAPVMSFGAKSLKVLSEEEGRPFCAQAAIVLRDFSIEQPGAYAFVVTETDAKVDELEADLARAVTARRTFQDPARGLHAVVPFVVSAN